jgi:transcription elongation factor Elf1
MGRRKKAVKVVKKKKKMEVAKTFKCLFCNHDASVACKLDFNTMIGDLYCRMCEARFQTSINSLTDPIDVFSEWLDEAEVKQTLENRAILSRNNDD